MLEVSLLLLIMIGACVLALEIKDLLSSVVIVSVVGLFLSVAFLLLKAPDLAMMQIVMEIVMAAVLIRAIVPKDKRMDRSQQDRPERSKALAMVVLFGFAGLLIMNSLPIFGKPLYRGLAQIAEAAVNANITNLVSFISLKCRILDAACVMAALFAVVCCVWPMFEENKKEKF